MGVYGEILILFSNQIKICLRVHIKPFNDQGDFECDWARCNKHMEIGKHSASLKKRSHSMGLHDRKVLDALLETSAPNCIKDFLDLPDDTGQTGLTLQLFPMVILVNQVWRYNCFHWKQL